MGTARPHATVAGRRRGEFELRVIAGRFGGRRLHAAAEGVRPTSDRVREALFSILGDLEGEAILDLYAGSGALGIEALSRGARRVVFVERSRAALAVLLRNLAGLGLEASTDEIQVVRADCAAAVRRLGRAGARFERVFVDPPYAGDERERILPILVASGVLAPQGQVVVETSTRRPLAPPPGLAVCDERRYGETLILRLEAAGPPGAEPPAATPGDRGRPGGREDPMSKQPERAPLAVFPASFDPVTNGHLDILERSRAVFGQIVVAVARNIGKSGTFSIDERVGMLEEVLQGQPGVRIDVVDGLLVDYARRVGARVVIRGLRAMSDFEYEFEMAQMNKHLYPQLETVFMMTSQEYFYVSSSRLKELTRFGGAIDDFVPALVAKKLREKLRQE